MSNFTYTLDQLKFAASTSISLAETIRKLNLIASGGAYKQIKKNLEQNNIDISHFKGQGYLKGKTHNNNPPIPLVNIIYNNFHPYYSSNTLKKRLIKEGYKKHECEICHKIKWNGKEIPIQLDHIDGNPSNNHITNLRILCPNCHTQTDTYAGKNIKIINTVKNTKPTFCIICGKQKHYKKKFCSIDCSNKFNGKNRDKKYKIEWPEINKLKEMVNEKSYLGVGKILGVSDNAIRKHIKMVGKVGVEPTRRNGGF